uniref:Amidase domain-containing protein n=1 Tax=Bursaphelenchus xylophilus TaxID=6326 RepID=A0A1I7S103_BURXY
MMTHPTSSLCITGGSAGGEGALNGSGATPFGVVFDIGGGTRIPAALNGVYGLKPTSTPNLLNGIFPEFHSEDIKTLVAVGPICRYAKDLALLYSVISSTTKPSDYESLRPSRLLFYYNIEGPLTRYTHESVVKSVDNALKTLESKLQLTSALFKMPYDSQMVGWFAARLAKCAPPNQAVTDIFFNRLVKPNMKFEKLKVLLGKSNLTPIALNLVEIEAKHKVQGAEIEKLLGELEKFKANVVQELSDGAVLICPTLPRTHYLHHESLLHIYDPVYTFIFNLLGLPAVTVPTGLDPDGYPTSVQLVAAPGKEWLLIRVAEFLEGEFGGWRSPQSLIYPPTSNPQVRPISTPKTTSV